MKRHAGFTLIELMIVVAIIAILASIALGSYLDYVARAQVSEGMSLVAESKDAVTEYFGTYSAWPSDNSSAGLAQPTSIVGKYVSRTTVVNGVITIAYNRTASSGRIKSQTLVLTPQDRGGSVAWDCSGTLGVKYLPTACH